MLKHTFCHIPGFGASTERALWRAGLHSWDDIAGQPDLPLGAKKKATLQNHVCESIAQLGAYALLARPDFAGRLALFGGLDGVRFRRQVLPGERLDLEVELSRLSSRAGKGSGLASVAGEEACRCELLFVFADSV